MKLGKRYRGADLFEKSKYSNLNICLFSFVLVLVSRLIIYVFYQGYAAQTGDVRGFLPALNIWDAQWYRGITAGGYTYGADYSGGLVNWAFFPLFSVIVRGAHAVTGADIWLLGFILNIIFQAAALFLIFKYVLETRGGKAGQAIVACVLLSMGCYSFYFASYYTESLYLLLFTGSLYFLYQRNYLLMGVFGFFLTLTRNTGIVLLLGLLVQVIADYCKLHGKKSIAGFFRFAFTDWRLLLGAVFTVMGLVIFMSFLWTRTGDPLAFIHAQAAWGGGIGNPFATIISGFTSGEGRQAFFAACAVWGLILSSYLLWKKRFAEAAMAFALLLIPVSVRLQSIPRYLVGNVVFMLGFTDLIASWNKKWITVSIVAISVLLEFGCLFLWFRESTFLW